MEEMTNMNWEAMLPPENFENDIKQIEKTLKKRSRKTILTAVVLVIILLLSTVYGIVPLAESFYWSPLDTSFDQYYTDLTLVLRAYTELFMPGKAVSLLWGDVGTGKSFIAGCIANALLDKGVPVIMTNFARLLNKLTDMYAGDRNAYIDSFNRYQLMIIDDLGIERNSEFAR